MCVCLMVIGRHPKVQTLVSTGSLPLRYNIGWDPATETIVGGNFMDHLQLTIQIPAMYPIQAYKILF